MIPAAMCGLVACGLGHLPSLPFRSAESDVGLGSRLAIAFDLMEAGRR